MTELKAFFRCLAAHVKMEMMYRTHLVVGLVSQLTFSLLSIVFVGVFLPPGSSLQGWGFWEILFLLGLGDATFGLSAILVFRTFLVFDSAYVLQGELDTLLVQPVHPLFNLILRNLQVMEFITLLKGLALAAIAGVQAGLTWTPAHILLFAGMIVFGRGRLLRHIHPAFLHRLLVSPPQFGGGAAAQSEPTEPVSAADLPGMAETAA